MMNNHYHLQHDHPPPQNVAHPFMQQQSAAVAPAAPPATSTTYGYLPQPQAGQQPQWMTTTYQILPPTGGPATVAKRFYATAGGAPQQASTHTAHPSTIQITNSFAQQATPTKQQAATSSSPFKANNIRIISTAPSVYSLNKSPQEPHSLYAPVQSYYLPSGAGQTAGQLNLMAASGAAKQLQPPPLVPVSNSSSPPSTVVLDRINICINNHYAESPASLSSSLSSAQQPSPIIPAIQHKAILPLIDSSTADSSSCSSSSVSSSSYGGATTTSAAVVIVDEPDSTTTTPQTPPTTPETMSSPGKSSPSPPLLATQSLLKAVSQMKPSFKVVETAPPTPPTPPSPPPSLPPVAAAPPPPAVTYALQEDVFIKCNDGRFYLGTIIEQTSDQYLIRFDDRSEQWCEPDKLRKLGGGSSVTGGGGGGSSSDTSNTSTSGPMCVACKRSDVEDVVEICERCGRGYHRGCTIEIVTGSGIWSCKRCAKPMKMQQPIEITKPAGICRQLPYHADKLSWDEKHRVNEEQIYCYCGKPGKFDHNMLQCCKCRNWFHTQCMQNFKRKLLRGDMFFVFCCTVCNNGVEFVRRLQIDWVDVLHIALYNLRKHQHQKYHHLLKDIWPFILEQRHQLPICEQWRTLPETALMERIKQTLKDYSERFVCGREFKRAPAFYALRHSGPPLTPKVFLEPHEELCDELLVKKFKLMLMPEKSMGNSGEPPKRVPKDVYEFNTDEDEPVETSEDEIPIKQIIEKAKKQASQKIEEQDELPKQPQPVEAGALDLADDNANDGDPGKLPAPIPPLLDANSSRKRKAFRLSKRYDNSRNHCDLSSDENSSSSRGTSSLDLIIPPPANFLGRNNPFLMATPKKATQGRSVGGVGVGVNGIINSIFKLKGTSKEQPRMVRTIKRRLSAKDITIGPNQEVRRRRNRRLTTAIEVISTTTINPIPSHYLPLYAKDLQPPAPPMGKPTHGRLLRQRPQKLSPSQSRRNSTSSTATTTSSSNGLAAPGHSMLDLKQSVNKYFGGAMNRIDAGESFAIRAKRRMGNGQVQYLVEWGGDAAIGSMGN
ncbi:polycomb protein Pcl [Drosophila subpulchrella]|uniref:polycomb protein Pcl n=1 Tax=Drosophila subpulchrella TaxID=1486046 RepID=UPI0018A1833E|nr:polycomb protein Pcl [Drosophila subpulchrella]XP_037715365.1 polycomb protein Pcl [Drosophila subpulchrella]